MEHARDGLAAALVNLPIKRPACTVYLNVTAEPTHDPPEIRKRLLEQLTAPVRWSQTMRQMHSGGAVRFVEVGAGNVLAALARRTLGRDVEAATAGTIEELEALRDHDV
jgi:[acyl-carrier-protein] S-malonyltransferase